MKNDRLFQILYLLLEKGTMTAPELSRALEVSVRTIYRDIDALSLAGVPVYATQGKNGGVSLLPNYAFDKVAINRRGSKTRFSTRFRASARWISPWMRC